MQRMAGIFSLFAVVCITATPAVFSTYAADLPDVLIEGTNVAISGEGYAGGEAVTCIVLNPGYTDINLNKQNQELMPEEVKAAYYYCGQTTAGADGRYGFAYKMSDNDTSGDYAVFVGGKGAVYSGPVVYYYASISDREKMVADVNNAASPEDIRALLSNEANSKVLSAMGLRIARYIGLSNTYKSQVDAAVFRNGTDYTGKNKDIELAIQFNNSCVAAMANAADNAAMLQETILQCNDILKLDMGESSVFGGLSTSEKTLAFEAMLARGDFADITELKNAFEEDIRIPVVNKMAYGDFESVVTRHNQYLKLDLDKYHSLGNTGKVYVAKQMAAATFTSIQAIRDKYSSLITSAPSEISRSGSSPGGISGKSSSTVNVSTEFQQAMPQNSTPAPQAQGRFTDLENVPWAKESILALADRGVVAGDGSGAFRPNDKITREEFVKIITSAFGLVKSSSASTFADVSEGAWYYKYVSSAKELNIVSGINESEFGIGLPISRQDMATISYKTAKQAGITLAEKVDVQFADAGDIGDYAKEAVSAMTRAGIIIGVGEGYFKPNGNATRAQACRIIYHLLILAEN